MKKIFYTLAAAVTMMFSTSCNDWLTLLPNNEQVSDDYWKSKEDVEAVVTSGYYYLRETISGQLLPWGELRGDVIYTIKDLDHYQIQNFDILPTNKACDYSAMYKVISMANSVLKFAPGVQTVDKTYHTAIMNSHLCEAYFLRAYANLILMKTFKDFHPIVMDAFVTDESDMFTAYKMTEQEIVAMIKSDIVTALETGAAKSFYEEEWQTKGRATKWALYALMVDICLWNHDFDEAIQYANMILDAEDAMRPAFITSTSKWYDIFYPGNSNESIFELNYDYNNYQEKNKFGGSFGLAASSKYLISESARTLMQKETDEVLKLLGYDKVPLGERIGRMLMATYVCGADATNYTTYDASSSQYYVWKYCGTDILDIANVRTQQDANFILYRVADVMLMKAEALIMKGEGYWQEAVRLINKIRVRAGISPYIEENDEFAASVASESEMSLMTELLNQRALEFVGEGKRWYDLLRLARYDQTFEPGNNFTGVSNGYKEMAIVMIMEGNNTMSDLWIQTQLENSYAWYLPIPKSEIDMIKGLEQNPFYESSFK